MIAENADVPLNGGAGNKARGRIMAPALQNIPSVRRVRREKVLAVREQLAENSYDVDERLNAVVDRLFAGLSAQGNIAGRSCSTVGASTIHLLAEQNVSG